MALPFVTNYFVWCYALVLWFRHIRTTTSLFFSATSYHVRITTIQRHIPPSIYATHCLTGRPPRTLITSLQGFVITEQYLLLFDELLISFGLALVAVLVLSLFVLGKITVVALVCVTVVRSSD